jgi:fructose-1,6-bisphosphatase
MLVEDLIPGDRILVELVLTMENVTHVYCLVNPLVEFCHHRPVVDLQKPHKSQSEVEANIPKEHQTFHTFIANESPEHVKGDQDDAHPVDDSEH